MTLDVSKVRVAVTGAVMKGLTSATAPTGTGGTTTGFTDLGFISEDGVEITMPDAAGDSTPIKAWQNGTTVRTIRTPSDDQPTWHFTMLETKLETVEAYFGVTVTQTVTEGNFTFTNAARPHNSYIVDVVDGAELIRDYIPYGVVTDVGAIAYSNGDPIGYEVTVSGDLSPTTNYNFKRWATALKT
jgi:hypothetical protein